MEKSVSGGDPRFSGHPILVWSLWLDFLLHFFISHTVQCWYCFHSTVFYNRIRLWMQSRVLSPSDWIVLVMTFWVWCTLCMCSNAWCAVTDFLAAISIISYHHNMQVALLGEGVVTVISFLISEAFRIFMPPSLHFYYPRCFTINLYFLSVFTSVFYRFFVSTHLKNIYNHQSSKPTNTPSHFESYMTSKM